MIEYKLEKNELTPDQNDYRAVVVNSRVFTQDDVRARMLESGAGLTMSDILAIEAAQKQALLSIIREGGVVNGDMFHTSFTIPGKFSSLDDAPHTVEIHFHPSHDARDAAARLKTRRVPASGKEPAITAVQDVATGNADTITSGGVFVVKGSKIKVAGSHPDVGVSFKNAATGAETKFAGHFADNTPAKLTLQAPTLPAGAYRLVIKTQFTGSGGKELTEPRILEYHNTITVI